MNNYYRAIPSEEHSDFEDFYKWAVQQLPDQAFVAELGISEGRSVILLASLMSDAGKRCHIWAVDNFSYAGDAQRTIFETHVKNSGETTIETYDMESLTAATRCQDAQFDLVFIDSSHLYEQTRAEIMLWFHKVKNGGVLGGHDYCDNEQVKQAVDEMFSQDLLCQWDTPHGHGVWFVRKTPDLKLLK